MIMKRQHRNNKFKGKYRSNSSRLQSWNYSWDGYYYITIATKDKQEYFGYVKDGKMVLNMIGKIAEKYWLEIPKHFPFVYLDEFVIMPHHVHGILIIDNDNNNSIFNDNVEKRHCLVSTDSDIGKSRFQNQGKNTISSIIGSYKSICTKTINKYQNKITFNWQSKFYDHIIRNEESLNLIRQYIVENPLNWEIDKNIENKLDI